MLIWENIRLAISAIWINKMRSFLTMLGMIIGIFSVITIVSLGDTMRGVVAGEYENVGTGLAYVYMTTEDGYYTDNDLFSQQDAENLREAFPKELTYVGFNTGERLDVTVGRTTEKVYFNGLAKNPEAMKKLKIIYGRMLSNQDIEEKRNYVVLDKDTALSLFGKENAVGSTFSVTINREERELLVIGIYENTDSALMKMLSGGGTKTAYIPESIYVSSEGNTQWTLYFIISPEVDINQTQQRVVNLLSRIKNKPVEQIVSYSAAQEMSTIDTMLGSLSAVVGAIAAISLLVGGIGIMNIMLVSVTERTREIGIRKALGARMQDIMTQFLIEAAIISALGGLIGTLLGIGVISLAASILGVKAVVKPTVILLAVAFSAVVGLGFGMYPARKAAKKDPVEALRFE